MPIYSLSSSPSYCHLSLHALEKAGQMALALDAQITVVHIMDAISMAFGEISTEQFEQLRSEGAAQAMVPLIKRLLPPQAQESALGNRLLKSGKPATQIVRTAQEGDFDIIVMASQGKNGWRHLFVGSVAGDIVRTAPCPVLVVGHGMRPANSK